MDCTTQIPIVIIFNSSDQLTPNKYRNIYKFPLLSSLGCPAATLVEERWWIFARHVIQSTSNELSSTRNDCRLIFRLCQNKKLMTGLLFFCQWEHFNSQFAQLHLTFLYHLFISLRAKSAILHLAIEMSNETFVVILRSFKVN